MNRTYTDTVAYAAYRQRIKHLSGDIVSEWSKDMQMSKYRPSR
jgi:hypothetical protein